MDCCNRFCATPTGFDLRTPPLDDLLAKINRTPKRSRPVLLHGCRQLPLPLGPNISCLVACLRQPLSPTTHSPSSLVGGGGADYLRVDTSTTSLTTLNKAGQRKKRQRSHGDAQQWVAAMPAVLTPTAVAFVPVHTLNETSTFRCSSLPRMPTETASSSDLARAVSSETKLSKNSVSSLRPRTSTGCERGTRSTTPQDTRGTKGIQGSRMREVSAISFPFNLAQILPTC